MTNTNRQRVTGISSQRNLEKEFHNITRIFIGKETEFNWEARDAAVKNLRSILSQVDTIEEYKVQIVQGIHDHIASLIKNIHSLRTSVSIEALTLISDISITIGYDLDQYTMEIILLNLLKCSSVTKKMIFTRAAEVTNTFLSHTNFYSKMMIILCKTANEKNVQLRQFSSNYIHTLLETHGPKEHVRTNMKVDLLALIDQFLKKGLVDAAPTVRDACKNMYWTYNRFFPFEAESLCKTIDSTTQRQLEKSKTTSSNKTPRPVLSKSNSMSSASSRFSTSTATTNRTSPSPSTSTSTSFKKPALLKSLSAHSITNKLRPPIPATSSEVRRNLNAQKISRLSHISNASAPSTTISHKMNNTPAIVQRRTQSEYHHQSVLASASLLHMLKSSDTHMKCKGIRQLSDRLKNTLYSPSSLTTILPPDVPSKIDLLSILMDYLTRRDLDYELYQTLMSWESLAGIFVHLLSVNYYCPTLIIADAQSQKNKQQEIYSKGLSRVKMFLKRNDPQLAQSLLDILRSVLDDQKLLDASVKHDLRLFPAYKMNLQCGLLNWMDEIICVYIGLPEDEDNEMLMEGSKWLGTAVDELAGQWLYDNQHVQLYVSFIIERLLKEKDDMYPILCRMAGHLKMANQRVFEKELNRLDQMDLACVQKALGFVQEDDDFSVGFAEDFNNSTVDIMNTDDMYTDEQEKLIIQQDPLMDKWNAGDEYSSQQSDNSGLTQDIQQWLLAESNKKSPEEPIVVNKENPEIESTESNENNHGELVSEDKLNIPVAQPIVDSAPNIPDPQTSSNKLARPAPAKSNPPRRISQEDHDQLKKKRKQNHGDGDDHSFLIELVSNAQHVIDPPLLLKIQNISSSKATKKQTNIGFWIVAVGENLCLLFALVNCITKFLINTNKNSGEDTTQFEALLCIKKLLVNQRELFQEIGVPERQDSYYITIYDLTKALVMRKVDMYSKISSATEEAMELLLNTYPPEFTLLILWKLSNDRDLINTKTKYKCHPLSTLYQNISKIAPKVSKPVLQQSLKNGVADTLVRNFDHTSIHVRQSCYSASVGIHQVLGEDYIKTYLHSLKAEQLSLLRHYINK